MFWHALTSALISEVWEEDVFLREDKQSQSASSQGVVVHRPRVGHDLPALVHHHPAEGKHRTVNTDQWETFVFHDTGQLQLQVPRRRLKKRINIFI